MVVVISPSLKKTIPDYVWFIIAVIIVFLGSVATYVINYNSEKDIIVRPLLILPSIKK